VTPEPGSFVRGEDITGTYALNLREDPRKSDSINVEVNPGNITFLKNKTVYLSYDQKTLNALTI